MSDQITKIIIRRGTDAERRTANGTGVNLNVGEPGYCTDTQRLFMGNGNFGGIAAGVRNLGTVNNLFANQINGYSFDANYLFSTSGAEVGDIIYDKTTRNIYSLTGRSAFPPLTSDFVKYDTLTLLNNSQFFYDNSLNLNLKDLGVTVNKVSPNLFDGITLTKIGANSPASLQIGTGSTGINNTHFQFYPSNSVLLNGNLANIPDIPNYVQVGSNQVLGRTSSSPLTSIPTVSVLSESLSSRNGILSITDVNNRYVLGLDPDVFEFNLYNTYLKNNLVLQQTLDVTGNTTMQGYLVLNNTIAVSQKGTFYNNVEIFGQVQCRSDILAFYTSDEKLKKNIKILKGSLDKIKQIDGVEFDWNESADHKGHELGVIAQQVEKVLPDVVTTRDNGYKAVRYEKIVPVLIEAVKELAEKVDKLESK